MLVCWSRPDGVVVTVTTVVVRQCRPGGSAGVVVGGRDRRDERARNDGSRARRIAARGGGRGIAARGGGRRMAAEKGRSLRQRRSYGARVRTGMSYVILLGDSLTGVAWRMLVLLQSALVESTSTLGLESEKCPENLPRLSRRVNFIFPSIMIIIKFRGEPAKIELRKRGGGEPTCMLTSSIIILHCSTSAVNIIFDNDTASNMETIITRYFRCC